MRAARLLALSEMPEEWAERRRAFREPRPAAAGEPRRERGARRQRPHTCCCRRCSAPGPMRAPGRRRRRRAVEPFRAAHRGLCPQGPARGQAPHELGQRLRALRGGDLCVHCDGFSQPGGGFLDAFRPLARRLAYQGMLTGLARTVLKCTAAGRSGHLSGHRVLGPVARRSRQPPPGRLRRPRARPSMSQLDWGALLDGWRDGRIKQAVLAGLLGRPGGGPGRSMRRRITGRSPPRAPRPSTSSPSGASLVTSASSSPCPASSPGTCSRRGPSPRTRLLGRHDPAGSRRAWRDVLTGAEFASRDGQQRAARRGTVLQLTHCRPEGDVMTARKTIQARRSGPVQEITAKDSTAKDGTAKDSSPKDKAKDGSVRGGAREDAGGPWGRRRRPAHLQPVSAARRHGVGVARRAAAHRRASASIGSTSIPCTRPAAPAASMRCAIPSGSMPASATPRPAATTTRSAPSPRTPPRTASR